MENISMKKKKKKKKAANVSVRILGSKDTGEKIKKQNMKIQINSYENGMK